MAGVAKVALADAQVPGRAPVVGGDLEATVPAVVGSSAQAASLHNVVLVAFAARVVRVYHELLAPAGGARLGLQKNRHAVNELSWSSRVIAETAMLPACALCMCHLYAN